MCVFLLNLHRHATSIARIERIEGIELHMTSQQRQVTPPSYMAHCPASTETTTGPFSDTAANLCHENVQLKNHGKSKEEVFLQHAISCNFMQFLHQIQGISWKESEV